MPKYQVYDRSFSMPCHMEGLFPMPCHMAVSRQDRLYVNFYIHVTDIFISIHFLFIFSSWLCNSGFNHIGQGNQVVRILRACSKYWNTPSTTSHMMRISKVILGVSQYLTFISWADLLCLVYASLWKYMSSYDGICKYMRVQNILTKCA